MNIAKICEALNETDELGCSVLSGCAIAQLFYASGKSEDEVEEEFDKIGIGEPYGDYFNGLLEREYGMLYNDVTRMFMLNDKYDALDRHQRILAHYENELIECLISESSSLVVEDLKVCADVSTAPLHMHAAI